MACWLTRNTNSTPLPDWLETVVSRIPSRAKAPFKALRKQFGRTPYDHRLDPNATITGWDCGVPALYAASLNAA